jgi:hypothetical protein
MMKRVVVGLLLIAGCAPRASTSTPIPAVDSSWYRLVGAPSVSTSRSEWIADHPRLSGLTDARRASLYNALRQVVEPSSLVADTVPSWTLNQTGGITSTAAIIKVGTSTAPDPGDRVIFSGRGTGAAGDPANYIGIASNIYSASPTITKSPAIDGPLDGTAISTSLDNTLAFAATAAGTVYGIRIADGTIAWSYALGAGVSFSTPWLDFGSDQLIVGDTAGNVTVLKATTGAFVYRVGPIAGYGVAIHSSPILYNNVIWIGADDGKLYRIDYTSGFLIQQGTSLCVSSSCSTADQIWSGATIETLSNHLYLAVNARLIEIDLAPTGCTASSVTCDFTAYPIRSGSYAAASGRMYSSPTLDLDPTTGSFIYLAFDNRLWRAPYSNGIIGSWSLATTSGVNGQLKGVNPSDNSFPRGLPINFNGSVFVGDGGGYIHRFTATPTTFQEVAVKSFANPGSGTPSSSGPAIDSTALIDYVGGNLYFGVRNPNSPQGAWVSLPQSFTSDTTTAGSATRLLVTPASSSVAAGSPFNVTVTALDANGNTATTYTGTIRFVSSSAGTMPPNQVFGSSDGGVKTVSGFVLDTSGNQTITAIDVNTQSIVGVALVCVGGTPGCTTPVVSVDRTTYAGQSVIVTYGAMPATPNDWVGLAPQGSSTTTLTSYQFTGGNATGILVFQPPAAGTYVARAFYNGTYLLLDESSSFTVAGASIATNASSYSAGQPIQVDFVGLAGRPNDWIAIAEANSPNTSYIAYQFTGGAANGSLTFTGLPTGTYVARAYLDGSFDVQAQSAAFTVSGPTVSAQSPVGNSVVIDFSGMKGTNGDWIAIAPDGSPDTSYVAYQLTSTPSGSVTFSNLPSGTYRARAYFDYSFNRQAESNAFTIP